MISTPDHLASARAMANRGRAASRPDPGQKNSGANHPVGSDLRHASGMLRQPVRRTLCAHDV
jgi:hypothetical protein